MEKEEATPERPKCLYCGASLTFESFARKVGFYLDASRLNACPARDYPGPHEPEQNPPTSSKDRP